jgi:glycosyltransferase involved in cell wall biosynthesis
MKESYPLVSVCILSYNRPQGLKNTLKAICGQSYANLEIIISDDYSPNAEVEKIANEFATSDTRVKFYRQKQNIGIIENHRFLLSKVTGKYMMWACDDDWWHMDFIKICVDALEKNDDAVLCTTNSSFLKNAKKVYTDHYENISTVGISENKTRFRKVFNTIFWWNNTV